MSDDPERGRIELDVMNALRTIYDPEIPVDIWNLGLIYGVTVTPEHDVEIQMTLTAPACPAAEMLPPRSSKRPRRCRAYAAPKSKSFGSRPGART
jgi:metal-sulfur cluster biosynthetic enzyme